MIRTTIALSAAAVLLLGGTGVAVASDGPSGDDTARPIAPVTTTVTATPSPSASAGDEAVHHHRRHRGGHQTAEAGDDNGGNRIAEPGDDGSGHGGHGSDD